MATPIEAVAARMHEGIERMTVRIAALERALRLIRAQIDEDMMLGVESSRATQELIKADIDIALSGKTER